MENLLSTKIKNSINELNETIKTAVAELKDVIETNLLTLDDVKKNLVYAHTELEEISCALYDASVIFESNSCECDECVEMLEDVNIHNFWGAVDYPTFQNVWKGNHPLGGQELAIGVFAMSNPNPEKTIANQYEIYCCSL